MNKRTIALPLAALALVAGGLTIGATLPEPGVGAATPTVTAAPLAATSCQEDEPCWDCETMPSVAEPGREVVHCSRQQLGPVAEATQSHVARLAEQATDGAR